MEQSLPDLMRNYIEFLDKELLEKLHATKNELQRQNTRLYWTEVKMGNYKHIFSKEDREKINYLQQLSRHLVSLQESIAKQINHLKADIETLLSFANGVMAEDAMLRCINGIVNRQEKILAMYEECKFKQNEYAGDIEIFTQKIQEKYSVKNCSQIYQVKKWLVERFSCLMK